MKEQINAYVEKLRENYAAYYAANYKSLKVPAVSVTFGKKYAKVHVEQSGVQSFVDMTTGDIFKPASWQAPAKHSRGNVNSEQNGMEAVMPCGHVVYLR